MCTREGFYFVFLKFLASDRISKSMWAESRNTTEHGLWSGKGLCLSLPGWQSWINTLVLSDSVSTSVKWVEA